MEVSCDIFLLVDLTDLRFYKHAATKLMQLGIIPYAPG